MLLIALVYLIINTILVIIFCNTSFILEGDKYFWNTHIILIISGICLVGFFLVLKFSSFFSIKRLFIMFLIIHLSFLCVFIGFQYGLETDFAHFSSFPLHVFNGELFTPYSSNWFKDEWRTFPPMFLWWWAYNYWIYGLNETIWRIVNFILEIGIVYVLIQLYHENSTSEQGWKEENFKIGLSFFIFSLIPISVILLYGNAIAFPVLTGLLGFIYFFRSKRNPKYIYYAVFFFCIVALTEFFAAIWIFGILMVLLFRRQIITFLFLVLEIIVLFCLISLPLLINDALTYFERYTAFYKVLAGNWDGSIWAISFHSLNLPEISAYIPSILAVSFTTYYIYKTYKSQLSIDFFIVILSIFLFFSPVFSPWHYLWIFPLLCLNILYSFRKFFVTNLFFLGYFLFFILMFLTAYLTYPGVIYPDPSSTYVQIFWWWMAPMGYFAAFPLIGHIIYQMGFIYLIFSYTKSKKFVLGLLLCFGIYYIFSIIFPINLHFSA